MGTANVDKEGPLGGSFSARWGDTTKQLDDVGKKTKEVAKATTEARTAWDRALDSASKRIAVQEAEAKAIGLGVGAQAKFRAEAELTEAALRSKLDPAAEDVAKKIKEIGERAGESATELAKLRLNDKIKFDSDTMFFTDKEVAIAREMKNIYGDEWQANMDSTYAKQPRINDAMRDMRDSAVDFAQTFVNGMLEGKSATEALTASLTQLGKKMVDKGIENAVNGIFGGNPAAAAGGVIQAGIGIGLSLFGKSAAEKQAERDAEVQRQAEIAARNRSKKQLTTEYTLRGNLAGLDQSTQAGALAAFDLRAAAELKQAGSTPGIGRHELVVAEEALAKERLKIIEDFAKQALDLERSYEDRIFAAQNDTSTLEGSLAAFDRAAAREREQAVASGGTAIEKLEQALAAERLRVIQDFVGKANAAESRRLSYADRLFAATTDTTTLTGALSAFDRAAAREREQEIADGGEAIVELEQALNAERLEVIKSFNTQIVDDTKQAEEQRRAALLQTTQQVLQYIQQLQTGAESPLSPGARLSAAQLAYNSTKALAMGGNEDAYGQFTQVAEDLRNAAKAMYGSAAGYQSVFNQIVADGLNLTAPIAATDPVVAKLQDVVTQIGLTNSTIGYGNNNNLVAINAVTGAVNTQGGNTTSRLDLTNTRVQATTTAVGATTTAVGATTTAVNTNNGLVTTGNTTAGNQLDVAEDQVTLLQAVKTLGDIQREIGNALGFSIESTNTIQAFWNPKLHAQLKAINNSGSSEIAGPGFWDFLGFESGGVVGNGKFGRDSVLARYAGGGNIMLAGGEGVLTAGATAAIGGRAAIDYINRTGMVPANDNGVAEAINNMNRNMSALLSRIAALEEKNASLTATLIEQNRDWQDEDKKSKRPPKVSRAA